MFASKCPLPAMVVWCRTLRHSLSAGLDPVRVFKQLGKSGPRPMRDLATGFAARLGEGNSLEDTLEPHRDIFPPLFVELVAVGEQTGRLDDTFRELEAYYETRLRVQRTFRSSMAYPAIQFTIAVLVIALLIFVLGMLAPAGKAVTTDPLGIGLTGTGGAATFLVVCFGGVGFLLLMGKYVSDNVRWRARLEGFLLAVPAWGPAFLAFATHRFAIALRMCSEAGLRTEKTMHYSFRASANSAFQRGEAHAVGVVKRGGEIADALEASGAPFPAEFRDSIMVGEQSGQLSEVCERLAENYREEGERRLKAAAQYTSYAIAAGVAILIIVCIFKIASIYLGAIGGAMK